MKGALHEILLEIKLSTPKIPDEQPRQPNQSKFAILLPKPNKNTLARCFQYRQTDICILKSVYLGNKLLSKQVLLKMMELFII